MQRILIVDDNEDIRKIIVYDLLKAGYDVEAAKDGESGYRKIMQEQNFDLILIDWMMPGKNGIELVQELRRHHIDSVLFMLTAKALTIWNRRLRRASTTTCASPFLRGS